jgi:N-acyl-D-amino-acid deacylase
MKILFPALLLTLSTALHAQPFDLLLTNGKIIDGTGNGWFYGDVGIRDGKIAAIGKLRSASATRRLDASGLVVAPGFIDVHAHIEGNELSNPNATNFVFDGVTTVVTGNCGGSNLEIPKYFKRLDSIGMSINVATLVGHNTIRRAAMGDAQRDPTPDELRKMERLVTDAMEAGAVGFSTGLIYVPGTYAQTPEIVALAKVAANRGGVYASHIRDEGDRVTDAVSEAIRIGREASIPVEISHFKVTYRNNWGRSTETLALVEQARQQGLDVTIDQYPYVASSTTLDTTVPTWVFAGGRDSLKARLANPALRAQIKKEMEADLKKKKLKDYSYAQVARYAPDTTLNGKNISQINQLRGRKHKPVDEAETILEMVAATNRTQMVYFSMNEQDLVRILQYPHNMIASDAGITTFGSGMPHPRAYGTNARVLGRYVREQKVLSLEDAIRRMTSLPAQKFNLRNRGLLREGFSADVVVFDPATVADAAEYAAPHAYAKGFRYVLVNGKLVIDNSQHTGVRSGQVVRR